MAGAPTTCRFASRSGGGYARADASASPCFSARPRGCVLIVTSRLPGTGDTGASFGQSGSVMKARARGAPMMPRICWVSPIRARVYRRSRGRSIAAST
ncbi:hypothetical protein [Archangium sp.]|uniref:hypothetical protein n=1 Tax=Archangium sp. TaxID=1872627 RepID=UPI002D2BF9C0|nr:hypothetical protein [Archangium sp.]HYO55706.1 hypothetical protein [Archangium sp.]